MSKLILCQGIQGSGKSTYAKKWASEDPEHRVRLNYDDLRNMMGTYWVPSREHMLKGMEKLFLSEAMTKGYDIIIDNMNLNPKTIKGYEDLVNAWNKTYDNKYEFERILFDTPVEECIRRDKARPNPIGEVVIKRTWNTYRNYIIQESIKKMKEKEMIQNPNLPHCILVDMDATLFLNTSGRPFYGDELEPTDILKDEPIPATITLVKAYQATGNLVIGLSGREDKPQIRACTLKQCENVGIHLDALILRPLGSRKRGDASKKELFEENIKDKYFVDFVLDDSSKVVKMYRDLGLTCLQPNEGKF
jgi:predicted kinase